MRDLLSKLDKILNESALNPTDLKGDYSAKRKALQDIQLNPNTEKDPDLKSALMRRIRDLEKEAKLKGVNEETTLQDLKKEPMAKDPVIAKAIKQKEQEEGQEESSDKERDTSWMRDPEDPESKIPAMFRKEKAAGRSAAEKSIDDLNKKAGAKVWRSPREGFEIGDEFGISVTEDFEVGTQIVDILEDGVVIELDETAIDFLTQQGFTFEDGEIVEEKQKGLDGKACWKGYRRMGTKMKGGKRVDNCVKVGEDSDVEESGLQYYTGKKKYGKEGMAALAAAGRKGASEEELGRIKDKYKKEDMDSEGFHRITVDGEVFFIKDSPEGPILQGEDIEGYWTDYDKEGWLDFEANIKTGEFDVTQVNLGANYGAESDWSQEAVDGYIEEIISKVRSQYGSTWDEISDELEGVSAEKEDLENIDEFFYFDEPNSKKKDRGPRDHGEDELERREKSFRKHELAKDGRDYKDAMSPKSKSPFKGKYNIAGPKGKLPEDAVAEGSAHGYNVARYFAKYQDQKKITNWLRTNAGLDKTAPVYFDDADLVWIDKTIVPNALVNPKYKMSDLLDAVKQAVSGMAEGEEGFSIEDMVMDQWRNGSEVWQIASSMGMDEGEVQGIIDDSENGVSEAEYQGRDVPLGKPMAGDVKKSKVYVKNPQGRVVKVNFGDKKMRIKKSNPNRRKSFRARHNCANPGPRHKARYWSCRAW
jgi:hypothetical protein